MLDVVAEGGGRPGEILDCDLTHEAVGPVRASARLAVNQGREFIEAAVLGTFGPVGFFVEVLSPPIVQPKPAVAQDEAGS